MSQEVSDDALPEEDDLERYAVLENAGGDDDLQGLVRLVADVCDVPTAAINIISRNRQHQIAATGLDPVDCSREDSMCALVLDQPDVVHVTDASQDERFASNAFVTGAIASVRFYASAPLVTPDGLTLGRLCVFDDKPRSLTPRQERALATLADRVMDVLELRFRGRELERSLAALTEVRDELRRSNEQLAHFAGQVSHDLRNPLTAILTTADVLATEPAVGSEPALLAMVSDLSAAGQRMNRMIEEALQLAMEGGRPQRDATDLGAVVAAVLADLRPVLDRTGAEVTTDTLPVVTGDTQLLYSVLLNLVANALKFTRPGNRPRVHVTAEHRGSHWRVVVDDAGRGIEPERREAVFDLYERRVGDEVEGHGIGLSTVRRLVEAHGGRCGADESPLGGARLWFELPA